MLYCRISPFFVFLSVILSDFYNFCLFILLALTLYVNFFTPTDLSLFFLRKKINFAQIVGLEGSYYPDLLHPGPGGGKSVGAQLLQQLRRKLSQVTNFIWNSNFSLQISTINHMKFFIQEGKI